MALPNKVGATLRPPRLNIPTYGKRALHPTTRTCALGGGQLHSRAYTRGSRTRGSRSGYNRRSRSAYTRRSHSAYTRRSHGQRRGNGLRY